jgi:hypothetical protein
MNTATRSVAVVATRLPTIDRRALSQAWYSALHLAQPPAAGSARPGTAPNVAQRPAAVSNVGPNLRSGAAGASMAGARASRTACTPQPQPQLAVERRSATGALARRIERAVVRHNAAAPLRHAAIAIDAGNGRVRIYVRTDGATTRIVALCAPQLRERVDRALAQARFALAGAGVTLEVTP